MKKSRLLYSKDADWVYATGMSVSDPHPFYQDSKGTSHALVGSLEYDIARREAHVDHVHNFEDIKSAVTERNAKPTLLEMIYQLVIQDSDKTIQVPATFPARLFQALSEKGLTLEPVENTLFPERGIKSPAEVEKIHTAQRANEQGFQRAQNILTAADVGKDNHLFWQGAALTSQILQAEICKAHLDAGCTTFNDGPIVTCLEQAAIPHERGRGPLVAETFILIDAFPRHINFYNGDLTRTYLKGTPSQWHLDVYAAVKEAQTVALEMIGPGVKGKDVHMAVEETFARSGFETGTSTSGHYYGFFHGTGHSIGMDVHDPGGASLSNRDDTLQPGHVITVEPGLYYPAGTHKGGVGGCRLEDVVVITEDGYENLTTLPKDTWIID